MTRLLLIIDAVPTSADIRSRIVGVDLLAGEQGPQLAGTPRTVLDEDTMALLG